MRFNLPKVLSTRGRLFLILLVLSTLSSCAFGKKINYQGISAFAPPVVDGKVAIVMQDHRPYVLNGDKNLDWVGLSRALNGIPYGVHTQSGRPLADDLGGMITNTINKQDTSKAYQVVCAPQESKESIMQKIGRQDDLLFLIAIREWKTDSYFTAKLYYELTLDVYAHNQSLVSNTVKGSDPLDGKNIKRADLATATANILEELLNSSNVVSAIRTYQTGAKHVPKSSKQLEPMNSISVGELDKTKDRLDKLKKAKEEGIITEQEYVNKRKAIVDAI